MDVFGEESPPVQPPQGRSGKFWTHFSPVMTGEAGQSSGSRSPEAAQAAARSSPDLDGAPCHGRTPARDLEWMLHPRPHLGRRAARCQRPALAGPAVSSVSPDPLLFAVQKPVRLLPVHLRISDIVPVPGRRRRRDDGGVNDAASFSSTPARPGDPRSAERQVRQSAALQPAAEVGTVVSSDTFSRLAPARRRTLSASQAGPPSPDRSGCRMAERSARTASPAADAAAAPCGHPLDTSAQCGPSAPERSRGASCASCNRIRGWRRSIAEGAACRDPPKERRGAKWQARPQCTMPCPKSGCIQRFPS